MYFLLTSIHSYNSYLFQDSTVEDLKTERKLDWDNFMQGITSKYNEINNLFETKEADLEKSYQELEKKLLL